MTIDDTDRGTGEAGHASPPIGRRAALKAFVGFGLASGLAECAAAPGPAPTTAPAARPVAGAPSPAAQAPPQPAVATPTEEHVHPGDGDVLVFALGDREGQVIAPSDVPLAGPQLFAYPADPDGTHVASESRLDQVILLRMDPSSLTRETAPRAADGIVAYSAVCTHEGCDISDWNEEGQRLVCPCHDSEFDPSDNGRATEGPARRRLAALPLKIVDGALMAAGGFVGRVGFQRR